MTNHLFPLALVLALAATAASPRSQDPEPWKQFQQLTAAQKELVDDDWQRLLLAAHADKAAAFREYSQYYLSTSGQLYWSDTHQLSTYLDNYHVGLDRRLGAKDAATELITEIYVPRPRLPDFMADVARTFRTNGVPVIYGTIRLIEKDDETFLAWATDR